jgi:hypothetical protein
MRFIEHVGYRGREYRLTGVIDERINAAPAVAGGSSIRSRQDRGGFMMSDNSSGRLRPGLIACAACILTIGASAAMAGEIAGNGRILKQPDGTLHGQSECAYSGLNDVWEGDPDVPGPDGFFRTQSWGQLDLLTRIFLTSIGRNPGKACNPS